MTDSCALDKEIFTKKGKCKMCDAYKHPDIENKNCISCERQEGEIIQYNGTCKACPAGTYVGSEKHNCIPEICEEGEIMTDDGSTS
jgi:hypothetical protein